MDFPIRLFCFYAIGPVAYVVASLFATAVSFAATGAAENGYVIVFGSMLMGLAALVPFALTKLVVWNLGVDGALVHLIGGAIFGGLAGVIRKDLGFLFFGMLFGLSYWAVRKMGHLLVAESSE